MRDRMERLVLLPFSFGCVSESSVAVGGHRPGRTKPDTINSSPATRSKGDDEESLSSIESMKSSSMKFLTVSKPYISTPFHRLLKGFKTFSQLFVYKEEEMDEVAVEMEIGVPTDVKHVTHIGLDGSSANTTNPIQGWESLMSPDQLLSFGHPPAPPLRHLDLSMASKDDPPLVRPPSA